MRASASLWIKAIRFQLDTIVPLPRFVSQDSFQTVCDDKSGYDNREILFFYPRKVALQLASNGLAGTLSSTLYVLAGRVQRTSTILPVWLFLFRIPCSLNMDDRYTGQRFLSSPLPSAYQALLLASERQMTPASAAIFFVCYTCTLVSLGYFIGLDKSILIPHQVVPYLGYTVDSIEQAFCILDVKREKFCFLLCLILASYVIDLKTLQSQAGKYNSLSLVVPVSSIYIWSKNFSHSFKQKSEAKYGGN